TCSRSMAVSVRDEGGVDRPSLSAAGSRRATASSLTGSSPRGARETACGEASGRADSRGSAGGGPDRGGTGGRWLDAVAPEARGAGRVEEAALPGGPEGDAPRLDAGAAGEGATPTARPAAPRGGGPGG